jgi:hypothetical protein
VKSLRAQDAASAVSNADQQLRLCVQADALGGTPVQGKAGSMTPRALRSEWPRRQSGHGCKGAPTHCGVRGSSLAGARALAAGPFTAAAHAPSKEEQSHQSIEHLGSAPGPSASSMLCASPLVAGQ